MLTLGQEISGTTHGYAPLSLSNTLKCLLMWLIFAESLSDRRVKRIRGVLSRGALSSLTFALEKLDRLIETVSFFVNGTTLMSFNN